MSLPPYLNTTKTNDKTRLSCDIYEMSETPTSSARSTPASTGTPSSAADGLQPLSVPSNYNLTTVGDIKEGDSIIRQSVTRNFPVVTGSRPQQTCDFPPETVALHVLDDGRRFAFGKVEPTYVGENPKYIISSNEGPGLRELTITGSQKVAECFIKQDGSGFEDGRCVFRLPPDDPSYCYGATGKAEDSHFIRVPSETEKV
jgi:hypothetical protein